ncbi:TIR domain-containing protein, partial [Acinetobacter johnsonii]
EHGFLIGKLGRKNVAALVDGKLELPNDISGVVYISLDEASAWQLHLAKEMKQSGYDIDMNKLFF